MATQGEKVDELTKLVHTLFERVDNLRNEMKETQSDGGETTRTIADFKTELALLTKSVTQLDAWKNLLAWEQRITDIELLKRDVS